MREMVLDRCFSTGKEYTREELMAIVNRELVQRDMLPVTSRNTFCLDINEMNSKFHKYYGQNGIVFEDRHKKRFNLTSIGAVKSKMYRLISDGLVSKVSDSRNTDSSMTVYRKTGKRMI